MKFLIQDNSLIKTYQDNNLIEICIVEELTIEHFNEFGIDLGSLPNLTELRKYLEGTQLNLIYLSEEEIPLYYKEFGVPKGEFVEMSTDANISMDYVLFVKSITITANPGNEKDLLRFIISLDKGETWITYFDGGWTEIAKEEKEVIEKGMPLDIINSLQVDDLKTITETANNIRFCWYMRKANINTELNVSNISMKYEVNI